ncbi:hypothetical protein HCN44_002584 [Aphidius gifuensis]|uniref:Integral membrane protein 2 n=1 Tax=Aphidius gifuensis TaxID=684658 RepID=A0A834Y3Y0_APHGI|nr:integral membrane protein 2B [Aphidius gifuensis]KAF7996938.1 hypothetical protein HCN44_002584 [Aphidius gifuensis]
MTVITKAIGEKKPAEKMEQPLVLDDNNSEGRSSHDDPESGERKKTDISGHYLILRRPNISTHSMTLYCLLFTALLGMSIGVIGGVYIYRRYASEQMHRFRTGWYSIPYDRMSEKAALLNEQYAAGVSSDTELLHNLLRGNKQLPILSTNEKLNEQFDDTFQESFEIDLENEHEGIDVPDFRGGRQGRFLHDFNINLTGIIDVDGHSCFVMPLNRQRVLPPRNMYDLLGKMYDGYYEVNTEVVRETMKAVLPAIRDRSSVGTYIARECKNMPIYALEKINNTSTGISKREVKEAPFVLFSGNKISEFNILNMDEVGQASKSIE